MPAVSRRSDVPAQERRARENKNYTWSSPSPSFSFLTLPFFCLPLSFLRLSRSSCLVLFASPLSLSLSLRLSVSPFSLSPSLLSPCLPLVHPLFSLFFPSRSISLSFSSSLPFSLFVLSLSPALPFWPFLSVSPSFRLSLSCSHPLFSLGSNENGRKANGARMPR